MSREVVKHFICCGKQMVIVELENSAHVMTLEEWKRVYGKLHPERGLVTVYDFEKDSMEEYSFGKAIPVGIYKGFSIKTL